MKRVNFLYVCVIAFFAAGFASCGDDDPKAYDKSNLVGSYSGECAVVSGNITFTDPDFPAVFATNSKNANGLVVTLGDDGTLMDDGLSTGNIDALNFDDHGSYASFSMGNITSEFTGDNAPDFIVNQVFFDVKTTKMTLTCQNPVRYDYDSKTLTFVYKGSFVVTGTEASQSYTNQIQYTFSLRKK